MGKFYESIPAELVPWINEQKVFWVATAPLTPDGHVNVSPKGVEGTFHLIDETTCWYEDLTGSGVETIAHLRENGRITIMFNAFIGPPRICRLFGKGTAYEIGSKEYDALIPQNKRNPGSRAVIMVKIHKVGTSCGYAVPYYDYKAPRNTLNDFFARRELKDQDVGPGNPGGMKEYWRQKNSKSIDGITGLVQALQYDAACLNTWTFTNLKKEGGNLFGRTVDREKMLVFALGWLACFACTRIVRLVA